MSQDNSIQDSDKSPELNAILENYRKLLENQANERNKLLDKVDTLTQTSDNTETNDEKLDNLVKLLMDIKKQVVAISSIKSEINIPKVDDAKLPSAEKIDSIESEIEQEGIHLLKEIEEIKKKIAAKDSEIDSKDEFINELNDQLEMLSFEKGQLITKLEELHSLTQQWGEQIDLLEKLANSDPRYRAIDTLKKHGSLTEIQLAFSMGTSIDNVRKYTDELITLKMIKKEDNGRYVWIGE